MSNEVMAYGGGNDWSAPARRANRVISRHQQTSRVRVAAADSDTDVALAKIENLTMGTGSAMSAVVRVAQVHRQLEQLVPEAAGRLALLADDHVLGMTDVLGDLRRDLRRR